MLFNEILDLQNRIETYENELHSDVDDELDYDPNLDPMAQAEELMMEAYEQSNVNSVSKFLEIDLESELVDPNLTELESNELIY